MYPSYDHIMMVYRIDGSTGYQDDGEHASGIKIHAKLLEKKCQDIAVFVARDFGGIHMGPRRFDCIIAVAEKAIEALIQEHLQIQHNSQLGSPVQTEQTASTPIQERLQNVAENNDARP